MHRRRTLWLLPAAVLAATMLAGRAGAARRMRRPNPRSSSSDSSRPREAGALVENIQPLADLPDRAAGHPGQRASSRATTPRSSPRWRPGRRRSARSRRTASSRPSIEAGAEIILQTARNGSGTYHTQFFTTDAGHVLRRRPGREHARRGRGRGRVPELQRHRRGPRRDAEGPIGLEALADIAAGHARLVRRADLGVGLHLPGDGPRPGRASIPETDIEPLFAGGHDASVIAVCEGQARSA